MFTGGKFKCQKMLSIYVLKYNKNIKKNSLVRKDNMTNYLKFALLMDDDFGILAAAHHYQQRISSLPPKFTLKTYPISRCKHDFRFTKSDIYRLLTAMEIPFTMKTSKGIIFKGSEGLCILLRRLAYPCRLADLQKIFGRSVSDLSQIFNVMLNFVYYKYRNRLSELEQWWLSPDFLRQYADVIKAKGCPLDGCFGFIDGTLQPVCRPHIHQKELYSGHKRTHGLKYQSVVLPNGLIANLYGPEPGRRHDAYMLKRSDILPRLTTILNGENLYLYGDGGYPIKRHLIVPYLGSYLSQEQVDFNEKMSKLWIAVEWEFGDLFRTFSFLKFKYNLKVFVQPVAKHVIVSAFLKNCRTCLYGCQTSIYYNLQPPNLESYINNMM